MHHIIPTAGRLNNSHTKLLLRGDSFTDASPVGRPISNVGSVSIVSAFGIKGLSFAGSTSQFLTTPDSSDFDLLNNDFTMESWINSNSSSFQTLTSQYDSVDAYQHSRAHALFFNLTTALFYSYNTSNTRVIFTFTFPTAWSIGSDNHLSINRRGTVLECYSNGKSCGPQTINFSIQSGDREFYVGRYCEVGAYYYPLNSKISNLVFATGVSLRTKNFVPIKKY